MANHQSRGGIAVIYNQSSMRYGISVAKLSDYLSLCKIDILVRNRVLPRPQRHIDQPSKVGKPMTITEIARAAESQCYHVKIDYSIKTGNREFTLRLKSEMSKQMKLKILSLTMAGTVILQQGNKELWRSGLYTCVSQSADNFANSRKSQWRFCLVVNQQENWVNALLDLLRRDRQQVDGIISIYQGMVRYRNIPRSERR
jgi:hypothetical protein